MLLSTAKDYVLGTQIEIKQGSTDEQKSRSVFEHPKFCYFVIELTERILFAYWDKIKGLVKKQMSVNSCLFITARCWKQLNVYQQGTD